MKTMNNKPIIGSNPYHNAFYVQDIEDLKYKYQREQYSFDIRFVYGDTSIVIARSYSTDIAVIDNKEKIMVISKSRYSVTTGKQIDKLKGACPPDYKVVEYDYEYFGGVFTHVGVQNIVKEAGKKAREYLMNTTYKSKEWRNYNVALRNYLIVYGNTTLYKRKSQEMADYEQKLKEKRELNRIKRREPSVVLKEKQEKFEKLIADGVPRIIARCRAKYIEPEYTGWGWDKSQVFVWSGRWKDKIKTTKGISFEPRHAETCKDFENFEPEQRVLGFRFFEVDEQDRFVIGCHKIPRREMEELREIWLKEKTKQENKKD